MTRWIYIKYYLFILSPKFCKASPLFTCFVSVYHYYLFEILYIHVDTYKSKEKQSEKVQDPHSCLNHLQLAK